MFSKQRQARVALVWAAVCGGATYPVIHLSVRAFPPAAFVLMRFLLAAALLYPLARGGLGDRRAQRSGVLLGLLEGSVGALVALNIAAMPASRCAFIMGTSVVMVPLWAALLRMQRLAAMSLLCCALSLSGLFILTGGDVAHLGRPELAVLAAAALWALNIVVVKRQTERHLLRPPVLAFYQALFNAVVPLTIWLAEGHPLMRPDPATLAGLGFCAGIATVMNLVIQATYQKYTSSTQAALRLSLEPLFAALFSAALLGDALGGAIGVGGALMVLAILLPELQQAWRRRQAGHGAGAPQGP